MSATVGHPPILKSEEREALRDAQRTLLREIERIDRRWRDEIGSDPMLAVVEAQKRRVARVQEIARELAEGIETSKRVAALLKEYGRKSGA